MIVTHTQNATGARRIYLGGKGSLECWIEPKGNGPGWSFHLDAAVTGNVLSPAAQREWAVHTLKRLAQALDVSPDDLASVPIERISTLHAIDPYAGRRVATPKRQAIEAGYKATQPHIRRPATDFAAPDDSNKHRQRG